MSKELVMLKRQKQNTTMRNRYSKTLTLMNTPKLRLQLQYNITLQYNIMVGYNITILRLQTIPGDKVGKKGQN